MYFTLALDIKSINIASFKPKLNIKNTLLLVLVIVVFLVVDNANSAPPPLPPALPQQEDNKINNKESKHESSFFDKIFGSKKSTNNILEKPVQQVVPAIDKKNNNTTEDVDNFINLGDKKLPVLESSGVENKGNTTSEPGNIQQQNDNIDNLIPSFPPQIQDDLNPYVKPVKNDDIPVAPTLENEVGNREDNTQVMPVLPPVPPSKVEVPQIDDTAPKTEMAPVTDTTPANQSMPVEIPVLPPVLPPSKVEVPKIDGAATKVEVTPATDVAPANQSMPPVEIPVLPPVPPSKVEAPKIDDTAPKTEMEFVTDITPANQSMPVKVPVLPPVLPPSKVEAPKIDNQVIKKEIISDLDTSSGKSIQVPVLPPVSVPEVDVTKPLSDKKDNIKTDIEQRNASPEKLLNNVKIPAKTKSQTPVPVFVRDNKPIIEVNKNDNEKIEKSLIEEQGKNKQKLSEPTVTTTIPTPIVEKEIPKKEMSEELVQFINNETQMLLLPNDDIVLGELTEDARIEQMEMYSFVTEFKKVYDRDKRKNQRQQIDNFINNYNSNFRTIYIMPCNVMNMGFDAIIKNDLSSLRGLLDNYPILQRKGAGNNTLLHIAAEQNNYYIAKFLIIRGINVNPINDDCKTALDIAQEECNGNIACLTKKRKNIVK